MTVKKAILIGLVLVLAFVGVPLLLRGAPMAPCQDCAGGPTCGPCVHAAPVAAALVGLGLLVTQLRGGRPVRRRLLLVRAFDRPPRSA